SRSRAGSSKPCRGRSSPPIAPIVAAPCSRSGCRFRREQHSWIRPHERCPLKDLVIDDEPPIRKLLRMGLSTQGYEILEASNGKIALELLAQNPDLIILDLGLPDIQGLDLLRLIRARSEGVPL